MRSKEPRKKEQCIARLGRGKNCHMSKKTTNKQRNRRPGQPAGSEHEGD